MGTLGEFGADCTPAAKSGASELATMDAPQTKADDELMKKNAEDEMAARRGRPASPRLFNMNSSSLATRMTPNRSGSSGAATRAPYSVALTTKAAQDSAVLTAVRRQMEALEDKLSGQIQRVQLQSDRLRDAALSRVDSKMGAMEAIQPKLDRRLAELSGNYKGLSDEMQAQIRRLDQMDSRLWEWRHQMEEEVRTKFSEIEQAYQKIASSLRVSTATNDDLNKRHNQRILRLEGMSEDRQHQQEEATQAMLSLHGRLSELEDRHNQDVALYNEEAPISREVKPDLVDVPDRASVMHIETRLSDACGRIDHLIQDFHDVHGKIQAQEERLKSLQTRHETKDEHYRELKDRVERTDWDSRLKELQSDLHEMAQTKIEHSERLELLQRKFDGGEQALQQAHEEACDHIRQMHHHIQHGFAQAPVMEVDDRGLGVNEVVTMEVKECMSRLEHSEARIDKLTANVDEAVTLVPRVGTLVDQLQNITPKVIEHETTLREFHEKVGRLEMEGTLGKTFDPGKIDGVASRIHHLEAELSRISSKVDAR